MKPLSLYVFRARPKKVVAPFPAFYCLDFMCTDVAVREYGQKFTSLIYVMDEEDFTAIIEPKETFEEMGQRLVQRFLEDPAHLPQLIAWSEQQKNSFRDVLMQTMPADRIRSLSNEDIARFYRKYVQKYRDFHLKNTPAWFIGSEAAGVMLRARLLQLGVKDIDDVFPRLTEAVEYPSESAEEELSLLAICAALKKKGIKSVRSVAEFPAKVRRRFEHHVAEFSSIPFGYINNVVWDAVHFIAKINEVLAQKESPAELVRAKQEGVRERKRVRDELLRKLKLPADVKALVIILRQLAYLQELKKITQTRSHPHLQLVVHAEIACRLQVPREYFYWLSEYEIAAALAAGKISAKLSKEIKERSTYTVVFFQGKDYFWSYGKDAREFVRVNGLAKDVSAVTEIRGVVASKGKVQGMVKVCKTSPESTKVKPSDILVTAMTTPDFVPAMKRAGAIVTDEGGITCHAAIVSRELKKPCIIGTKIATKVLKDGDLVEVDANKGVVRKLKP